MLFKKKYVTFIKMHIISIVQNKKRASSFSENEVLVNTYGDNCSYAYNMLDFCSETFYILCNP